jgi:hypothetical protein
MRFSSSQSNVAARARFQSRPRRTDRRGPLTRAPSNTNASSSSLTLNFASEPVAASLPSGEWIGRLLVPSAGDRASRCSRHLHGCWSAGCSARRTLPRAQGAIPGFQSPSTPHKRETNSLIAYRADGPGPRATSGQGRAYSAARGDRDSPDRPAPSANNSPARCTISKPRRRDLTVHSKIAGPSKCSYRLKCSRRSWFHIPLVVSYPACGAHFKQ